MTTWSFANSTNFSHVVITNDADSTEMFVPASTTAELDADDNLLLRASDGVVVFSIPIAETDLTGATAALKMDTLEGLLKFPIWLNDSGTASLNIAGGMTEVNITTTDTTPPSTGLLHIESAADATGDNTRLMVLSASGSTAANRHVGFTLVSDDTAGTAGYEYRIFVDPDHATEPGALIFECYREDSDNAIRIMELYGASGANSSCAVRDNYDRIAAGAVRIGAYLATSIELCSSGNTTSVKGPLTLEEELILPVLSSDPTTSEGMVWLYENGGTRELRVRLNGGATTYATTLA